MGVWQSSKTVHYHHMDLFFGESRKCTGVIVCGCCGAAIELQTRMAYVIWAAWIYTVRLCFENGILDSILFSSPALPSNSQGLKASGHTLIGRPSERIKRIRLWHGALVLWNVKGRILWTSGSPKIWQYHDMDFLFNETRKGLRIPAMWTSWTRGEQICIGRCTPPTPAVLSGLFWSMVSLWISFSTLRLLST